MTRVVHLGKSSKQIREMYRAVLEAQLAGIAAVRPGPPPARSTRATRNVLKKHKLDKAVRPLHRPRLGSGNPRAAAPGQERQDRLQAGMAITIEPGVYIEGLAGIRIEDTV